MNPLQNIQDFTKYTADITNLLESVGATTKLDFDILHRVETSLQKGEVVSADDRVKLYQLVKQTLDIRALADKAFSVTEWVSINNETYLALVGMAVDEVNNPDDLFEKMRELFEELFNGNLSPSNFVTVTDKEISEFV